MSEKQIHDGFIAWLKKVEVPFIHHRMDRRSGIQSGWPDFTILWMNRAVCIEIKTERGRVTLEQARVMQFIRRSGNKVEVCRSVEACVEAVKNIGCDGLGADSATPKERPRFTKQFSELKQKIAKVPGNGTNPLRKHHNGAGLEPFYVANWNGTNIVLARANNGSYAQLRIATAADVINLPKLPL